MTNPERYNAMTVDVEDYFHVAAFENNISVQQWDSIECRVERNVDEILALFSEHNIKATFFLLGWVAERYPALIKRVAELGHEVASHGYWHRRATTQTKEEFEDDVKSSKALLEDISGQEVKGYRAPSYSIGRENIWSLDVLKETGYTYSSSIYPVKHDLYGLPEAPRFGFFYKEAGGILEIPVTTMQYAGKNLPCGGGGFFRLFPYVYFQWAIKRVNRVDGESGIFYFHPWEIDVDQPRVKGASAKSRFRHYLNLHRMKPRLNKLLQDFNWRRMDELFLDSDKAYPVWSL